MADKEKAPDSTGKSNEKKQTRKSHGQGTRKRFYGILFLFVVVAGLPVVTLPSLRSRLTGRIAMLHRAFTGDAELVVNEVGAEQSPYPEEYKRSERNILNPVQSLPKDWIFSLPSDNSAKTRDSASALITPKTSDNGTASAASTSGDTPGAAKPDTSGVDAGLEYNRGDTELEAYALLLEKYPEVAEMVKNQDSSLQFQSWGGLKKGADVYWVRLIFKTVDGLEVAYIWQVELQSRKVLPWSHNARTIS